MRTTKKLSKVYISLQQECMDKIKSFFNNKKFDRIIIDANQFLNISTGVGIGTVTEVHRNGDVFFTRNGTPSKCVNRAIDNEPLPVDALLTILDELERMKKENQLKKP